MRNPSFLLSALFLFFILMTSCEKEIYTGPSSPEIIPDYGFLSIDSYPSDAKIFINEKNSSYTTPDTISWIEKGNIKVTLKKELFADTSFNLHINYKETTDVFIDYRLNPRQYGKIYFSIKPFGSSIVINDSLYGKSPAFIVGLWPGHYKAKYFHHDCRTDSSGILVRADFITNTFFELEDTTNWISYKTSNSKIPSNFINDFAVDKNNFVYVATPDGLGIFDGRKWTAYNSQNSILPKDYITSLVVDLLNNIWVGTQSGLFKIENGIWNDYTNQLPNPYVTTIYSGNDGDVWVATVNGLVRFSGSGRIEYNMNNSGIASNSVYAISSSPDGELWFGTGVNGISVFNGTSWKTWNMINMNLNPFIGDVIIDIEVDKDGNAWAAHHKDIKAGRLGGFTKFDGEKWTQIKLTGLPDDEISNIYIDDQNRKWIGTESGLGQFDIITNLYVYSSFTHPLVSNRIKKTIKDKAGNMWIGTGGSGISKIKRGNF